MRSFKALLAVLAVLAAVLQSLAGPAPVFASGAQVLSDCKAHSRLTQPYTSADLRNALGTMSADVREYTNCYDVIQRALLAQIGNHQSGGGSGAGSGGSFLSTPVIVLLVILGLGAATLGAIAIRRHGAGPTPPAT